MWSARSTENVKQRLDSLLHRLQVLSLGARSAKDLRGSESRQPSVTCFHRARVKGIHRLECFICVDHGTDNKQFAACSISQWQLSANYIENNRWYDLNRDFRITVTWPICTGKALGVANPTYANPMGVGDSGMFALKAPKPFQSASTNVQTCKCDEIHFACPRIKFTEC